MRCHTKQLLSISPFALGIFFSDAALAQSCKPTLYLLRHAEDVALDPNPPIPPPPPPDPKSPPALTTVGNTHADFYPGMIRQLEKPPFTHCPVARVFSMWDRNKAGTTNPYQTALPLAQDVGGLSAVPEMTFTDVNQKKYYLCEYAGDPPCEQSAGITPDGTSAHLNALAGYPGDSTPHLRLYLYAYFQANPNKSVALFYTSQGMPGVAKVLGGSSSLVVAPCSGNNLCNNSIIPPTTACPSPKFQTGKQNRTAIGGKTDCLAGPAFKEVQSTYFISEMGS